MVKLSYIINKLNELADPLKAEEYDNAGLISGDSNADINKILICLDAEAETVKFAAENGVNLIISHHPFIFNPIKHIRNDDVYFDIVRLAVKNDISIFSMHTNFDKCDLSSSIYIAKMLKPDRTMKTEDEFGCIGEYDTPMDVNTFINKIKTVIKDENMRFYINNDKISRFCCIAGAGGRDEDFFIKNGNSLDFVITSEVKHSVTLISKAKKFSLCDCSHKQSEIFFEKIIYKYLQNSGILTSIKAIIYDSEL